MHSRHDARVPFEQGLLMAREIPNARFVALDSPNHIVLSHEPAWQRFLAEVCAYLNDANEESARSGSVIARGTGKCGRGVLIVRRARQYNSTLTSLVKPAGSAGPAAARRNGVLAPPAAT